MKNDNKQSIGYGFHYHANNQLIKNIPARIMWQVLIDQVCQQLSDSIDNTTIYMGRPRLSLIAGLDKHHTGPGALKTLESLGLVILHPSAVTVNCDEYVTMIKYYENLPESDREYFANEFQKQGTKILSYCQVEIEQGCRTQLLELKKYTNDEDLHQPMKIYTNDEDLHQPMKIYTNDEDLHPEMYFCNEKVQLQLKIFSSNCISSIVQEALSNEDFQSSEYDEIKAAFLTGDMSENCFSDPSFGYRFSNVAIEIIKLMAQKQENALIKEDNIDPVETDETETGDSLCNSIERGLESFNKVDVIDLSEPLEIPDKELTHKQMSAKRAENKQRSRNPYKAKPFMPVEKVKNIMNSLPETVQSPVDFFLHLFLWGIYDLYCDHYCPSTEIGEDGELVEDPRPCEWREMMDASLPQDEVYRLAMNVYEDMESAIEQGSYEYENGWVINFAFKTFEEFNPLALFQWTHCTMQDDSIPALRVAIDKFYDIEAPDVRIPERGDKRLKSAFNLILTQFILSSDTSILSPIEMALKSFYESFVILGPDSVVDDFTDANRVPLETNGTFPDFLLRPWCIGLQGVTYDDFISVLSVKYKPCDGIRRRAAIFSMDQVIYWNELHGFRDSVAHKALAHAEGLSGLQKG